MQTIVIMVATDNRYMGLVYCSWLVCSKFLLVLLTLYLNLAFLQFLTFPMSEDQHKILFNEKVDIDQVWCWWAKRMLHALAGPSLRSVTRNTCFGWVYLILPWWWYGWNLLLLIEFTQKVTILLPAWRTGLQVTWNLVTALLWHYLNSLT